MSGGSVGNYLIGGGIGGALLDAAGVDAMHALAGNARGGGAGNLPDLGIDARFYDPAHLVPRPSAPGRYNAMASALAGPLYEPLLERAGNRRAPPGGNAGFNPYQRLIGPGGRRVLP